MSDIAGIHCPVCSANLKVTTSTSKTGKVALVMACTEDGRHFRGFINDREYVRQVLERVGEVPGSNTPAQTTRGFSKNL